MGNFIRLFNAFAPHEDVSVPDYALPPLSSVPTGEQRERSRTIAQRGLDWAARFLRNPTNKNKTTLAIAKTYRFSLQRDRMRSIVVAEDPVHVSES